MKLLKLFGLILISGCTINVITPPATQSSTNPSQEPINQPSITPPEELPDNLKPENTGSSSTSTIPTPAPLPTSDTVINNAPRSPIQTPAPPTPQNTATPVPETIDSAPIFAPSLTQSKQLEAPTNLRTSNIEIDSITITWKASANADYYRVYQDNIVIGDQITQLQYTAQNLSSGQSYEFQVSAINSQNEESPRSKSLSVGLF